MSIYAIDPEYSVSALNSSIPPSILPSMAQRPVAGVTSSMVSIVSQSSTQQSGGLIQINVPNQPNTYIKSGSSFLKMTVTLTTTGTVATNAWVLSGGNASQNWASLILRATMSCGPNILEQINQYSYYDELLNLHAGSSGYFNGNMAQLYGQQIVTTATQASGSTFAFVVCIPMNFGLLNSSEEQSLPIGLLNAGLQFQFDLQGDVNQAIWANAGAGGTGLTAVSYAVSNVSFNYESIKLPPDHFQALRAQMMSDGSLYQMPYVSALNMSIGASTTIDQTFGVGLSSLKGVFATLKPASTFKKAQFSSRSGMTQFRVLLDGQMINQYSIPQVPGNLNADNEFYVDLQRGLGVLGSVVRTAGMINYGGAFGVMGGSCLAQANALGSSNILNLASTGNLSNYSNLFFWAGLGCNRFCEHGLTYTGTPVSQLQIHAETITLANGAYDGATAISTLYLVLIFDSCLFINSQGDVSINR